MATAPEVQAFMEQLRLGRGEGDVHRLTGVVHAAMQGSCYDEALHFLTSSGPQAGATRHELDMFDTVPERARSSANGLACSLCTHQMCCACRVPCQTLTLRLWPRKLEHLPLLLAGWMMP